MKKSDRKYVGVPCTEAEFNASVEKFLLILDKGFGIKPTEISVETSEPPMIATISFPGGVEVEIDTELEIVENIFTTARRERPRFAVGSMVTIHNYPSAPDDAEFAAEHSTFSPWDAAARVVLLPREWDVDNTLENLSMEEYHTGGIK